MKLTYIARYFDVPGAFARDLRKLDAFVKAWYPDGKGAHDAKVSFTQASHSLMRMLTKTGP
jgi:hypothetical protein